jgi:TPR repeat protein
VAEIATRAGRDDPDSLFALAIIKELGRDLPQDIGESLRLLERAARLGHAPSKTHLGLLYQTGTHRPKDPARAHGYFQEAAAGGDAEGQFRLAMSYTYGLGTQADPAQARRWLAGAANQGHQEAQFALGVMLQQGIGGPKNDFAARRWLQAALAGDDATIVAEAKPLVQRLNDRLLYSGMTAGQVAAAVAAIVTVFGAAAALFGDDEATTFARDPDHPMNPHNYDAFRTARRRERCRFVSRRSGMEFMTGRRAMFPSYESVLVCS